MRPRLRVMRGIQAGIEYDLGEEETLLGRDAACGITLDDDAISRKHARLTCEGHEYFIKDLGSSNHTFVNGKQVTERVRLKHEDRIKVGLALLVFRTDVPAVAASHATSLSVLQTFDVRHGSSILGSVNAETKLQAILQITQALGRTLDLQDVLSKMLDGLFQIFPQADRGLVLLLEEERLVPKAVKQRRGDDDSIQYSKTVVERAMQDQAAILSEDVAEDDRFAHTQSLRDLQVRSIVCVPLLSQEGNALGVIQLDTQNRLAKFNAETTQILLSVASQAAVSVEYAQLHKAMLKQANLKKEMAIAEQVQRQFLPRTTPDLTGYSFFAHYVAAGEVGGDYYDFVPLPDGRCAVLLGDVAGKGVPAALMMAKLSAVGKVALLKHTDCLVDAMCQVNNDMCDASINATFVTLLACIIDPQTHEITTANAGHMSPLVRRVDGTVDEPAGKEIRGYPLGIVRDHCYRTTSSLLQPGEAVVLFSDGISEATNEVEEFYTTERLLEQVRQQPAPAADDVGKAIVEDVTRFTGDCEQFDDIALVVFARAFPVSRRR